MAQAKSKQDELVFQEVKRHHDVGFQETDRRATGKNRIGTISFDEADELFRSWIDENKWPYDALLFDPRVFTFIFEKTSRLISNKPQARLTPRQGGDVLRAKINNELLAYQWDEANLGGTMLSKWSLMDINARKYGASFALTKWRYECDPNGRRLFDGPEMEVLNNRDVAHDLTATSIENCNWFQVRQYVTLQSLMYVNDQARTEPTYKNLDKIREAIGRDAQEGGGGDTRGVNWRSRSRQIAGLENDPVGKDDTFKTVEVVTEYRKDRWITFAPKYGVVLRDIPNPYLNNEIPVVMLRYYAVDDDLYGLSEIEPIKGLQKAINAILCQYVDEINQKLYSPIAIGPGVRQHTLEWGKGARWIMNNPLTDFRLVESRSNAAQFFNNTYSVLVAAMMNALGESSLGVSNVQPYQQDKTATEIKALQLQRNARDNYNQIFLAEAIKRQYKLWYTMNRVLLFSDEDAMFFVLRLNSADDAARYFLQSGLMDEQEISNDDIMEHYANNAEIINKMNEAKSNNKNFSDLIDNNPDLAASLQSMPTPKRKYQVNIGTTKSPSMTDKLQQEGSDVLLYVEPKDLDGMYDFTIDVESMQVNYDEERKQARQAAVSLLATNPNVLQLLAMEQVKPKFKDLFVSWLEDLGFSDASRFFEAGGAGAGGIAAQAAGGNPQLQQALQGALQNAQGGQPAPNGNQGGVPGGSNPNVGGEAQQASPFSQAANNGIGPASPKSYQQAAQPQ